jgi:hypothetical protein
MDATSLLGSVVNSVKATPPCRIGRHRPAKQNQIVPGHGEFPLRLRRFRARELEEVRRRHETSTDPKASAFGVEIDDRWPLRLGWWKAPPGFREFVCPIFKPPNDGGAISRPDVVARFEIGDRVRPFDRDARLGERREVVSVIDIISIVVAHVGFPAAMVSI